MCAAAADCSVVSKCKMPPPTTLVSDVCLTQVLFTTCTVVLVTPLQPWYVSSHALFLPSLCTCDSHCKDGRAQLQDIATMPFRVLDAASSKSPSPDPGPPPSRPRTRAAASAGWALRSGSGSADIARQGSTQLSGQASMSQPGSAGEHISDLVCCYCI